MSLSNLLQHGHSAEEALALLIQHAPKLKKEAHKLLHSGWAVGDVLRRFQDTGKGDNVKAKPVSPSEIAALSIYKNRQKSGEQNLENVVKQGLPLALGAAGASAAAPYLSRALPGISGALTGRGTTAAGPAAQAIQSAVGEEMPESTPEAAQITAQPPEVQSPQAAPESNAIKLLGKEGFVDNLSKRNPPDVIASYLEYQLKPEQKKFVKENGIDLLNEVVAYLKDLNNPTEAPEEASPAAVVPEMQAPQLAPPSIQAQLPEASKQPEPAAPAVGKEVSLPDGSVGEIETIDPKGRYATVNVDGNSRRVKIEDISVEPEDVVAFVNQISGVPESERSRLISFFAYQPETKTLAVQYHNGEFYTYDDVQEDEINPVVNAEGVAKTTGKDEYGAHVAGRPDSRGAALIENIINAPKYKKSGKGQEKNNNYQRFNTLYDYFSILRRKPKKKKVGIKP